MIRSMTQSSRKSPEMIVDQDEYKLQGIPMHILVPVEIGSHERLQAEAQFQGRPMTMAAV